MVEGPGGLHKEKVMFSRMRSSVSEIVDFVSREFLGL